MKQFAVITLRDGYYLELVEDSERYLFRDGTVKKWEDAYRDYGENEVYNQSRFDTIGDVNKAIDGFIKSQKKEYTYSFPMAGLTADCIILRRNQDDTTSILLIRRGAEPFQNCLAMPGGFVNVNSETIKEACIREIFEEVSVKLEERDVYFFQFADKIDRDPRGRTITFVFRTVLSDEQVKQVKASDDAASYEWHPFNESLLRKQLAFDHGRILYSAIYGEL